MTNLRTEPAISTQAPEQGATPGPWFVDGGHGEEAFQIFAHEHGEPVYPSPVAQVYTETDARLIAAGPELLDACKLALGAFENNSAIDWSVLERAIAKATQGEEIKNGVA
jgi:hypothetical protein